ncbi:aldo-keto reductase [Geopyxis carbonaria]|nr:aldo-keto reductase [Geopyxis carbonaria]
MSTTTTVEHPDKTDKTAPSARLTMATTMSTPADSNPGCTPPALRRPRIGFGVYQSPPSVCTASCLTALATGYRHIDTAQYYENEADVGRAVVQSGLPRSAVYITTKILKPSGSVEATLARCRESIAALACGDYVDLFLIHTPSSGPAGRREMWAALEQLQREGGAREIGVSNYGVAHLEEMKSYSTVRPAVNQIEVHPWCQQRPITSYCKDEGIHVEAYSPLVRGKVFGNPTLKAIAAKHQVSEAKVLVRWALQMGYSPLPKSDHPDRIRENFVGIAEGTWHISEGEMALLREMDRGQEGAVVPQNTECP